jgi:MFS family permease
MKVDERIFENCSDNWQLRLGFSLVGKGFSAIVLATVFSYTAELFPTSARSSIVGLASTVGRLGGICAPFIASQVNASGIFRNRFWRGL